MLRAKPFLPFTAGKNSVSRVSAVRSVSRVATSATSRRSVFNQITSLVLGGIVATGPTRSVAASATAMNDMEKVLSNPKWTPEFPYTPENFQRYDETADRYFYNQPRYVTHIDDGAIKALTEYYKQTFPPSNNDNVALLDICSSWISHYPEGYLAGRVVGLGMNEAELARNPQLTSFDVKDLNVDPKLPYADNSFDFITNCVSVDYLNKPIEVFQEMHRCLKPGGKAMMSFSNRCFPTKAISLWTSSGDKEHIYIVGSYFHYSVPGGFTEPECKDITPKKFFGGGDPMYVVYATKKA